MGCGASRQQIAAIEAFTAQAAALAAEHQAAAERAAAVEHAESTPQPTAALAAAACTETADATTPAVKTAAPMQEEEAAQKVKAMATSEKRAGAALAAQQGKAWVELTWLERHELCTSPDAAAAAEVAARAALTRSYSSAHQQAPTEPTIVLVLHKDEKSAAAAEAAAMEAAAKAAHKAELAELAELEKEGLVLTAPDEPPVEGQPRSMVATCRDRELSFNVPRAVEPGGQFKIKMPQPFLQAERDKADKELRAALAAAAALRALPSVEPSSKPTTRGVLLSQPSVK
tara:strand:+ start:322 stop:1182 length:861 start_codon:yes stop_codon:yes gene_type:complete